MALYKQVVLTAQGHELLNDIIATSSRLEFTKVNSTSTVLTESSIHQLLNIPNIKQSDAIRFQERINETTIKIEALFSNEGLAEDYEIKAIGVYAKDADGAEVLFGVSIAEEAFYMPAEGSGHPTGAIFRLNVGINNTVETPFTVDPAAMASMSDITRLSTNIGLIESEIDLIDAEIINNKLDIVDLKDKDISIESSISTLRTDLTVDTQNLVTLENKVNTNKTTQDQAINDLDTKVASQLEQTPNYRNINSKIHFDPQSVFVKDFSDSEIDEWKTTGNVGVVNDELTMTSEKTQYLTVALLETIDHPRSFEVTVGNTGSPTQLRISFGVDANNFSSIIINKANKLLRTYSVEGGVFYSDIAPVVPYTQDVTISVGDKVRLTFYNQVIQLHHNNVLLGTVKPNDTRKIIRPKGDLKCGLAFRNMEFRYGVSDVRIITKPQKKYLHFSIDDCYQILKDLADNQSSYSSCFDNPILGYLKELHDEYGSVFSLYIFYTNYSETWNLSSMPTKFKEEFREHSDWLKFGFHAKKGGDRYDNSKTPQETKEDYDNVANAIRDFASGNALDTVIRTGYYSGSLENLRAMRDTDGGAQGFLSSDDSRVADMYLNAEQRESLRYCDDMYDNQENLYFIRTDLRMESYDNPVAELESRKENVNYLGQHEVLTIFTHEPDLLDNSQQENMKDLMSWAVKEGYIFDFPMNNIPLV